MNKSNRRCISIVLIMGLLFCGISSGTDIAFSDALYEETIDTNDANIDQIISENKKTVEFSLKQESTAPFGKADDMDNGTLEPEDNAYSALAGFEIDTDSGISEQGDLQDGSASGQITVGSPEENSQDLLLPEPENMGIMNNTEDETPIFTNQDSDIGIAEITDFSLGSEIQDALFIEPDHQGSQDTLIQADVPENQNHMTEENEYLTEEQIKYASWSWSQDEGQYSYSSEEGIDDVLSSEEQSNPSSLNAETVSDNTVNQESETINISTMGNMENDQRLSVEAIILGQKVQLSYDEEVQAWQMDAIVGENGLAFESLAAFLPDRVMIPYAPKGTGFNQQTGTSDILAENLLWTCDEYLQNDDGAWPTVGDYYFNTVADEKKGLVIIVSLQTSASETERIIADNDIIESGDMIKVTENEEGDQEGTGDVSLTGVSVSMDQSESQILFEEIISADHGQEQQDDKNEETPSNETATSESKLLTDDQIKTIKWIWSQKESSGYRELESEFTSGTEDNELSVGTTDNPSIFVSFDDSLNEWVFIITGDQREFNNEELTALLPDKVVIHQSKSMQNTAFVKNTTGDSVEVSKESTEEQSDQKTYADSQTLDFQEVTDNSASETENILALEVNNEVEKHIMSWNAMLETEPETAPEENKYQCVLEDGNSFDVVVKINASLTNSDIPELVGNSSSCGENLTWKIEGGTLSIEGTGEMTDYNYEGEINTPWYALKDTITDVIISDGLTSIGNAAFCNFSNLKNVEIPDSVARIGKCAFSECASLESITIPNGITVIEYRTFYKCTSLKRMDVRKGGEPTITPDPPITGEPVPLTPVPPTPVPPTPVPPTPVPPTPVPPTPVPATPIPPTPVLPTPNPTTAPKPTVAPTPTIIPIAKPSAPTAKPLSKGISLAWKMTPNASSYSVYKVTGKKTALLTTTSALTFTDNAVKNGTTYSYYITASAPGYQDSSKSNSVKITYLSVPGSLKAKAGKKQATITWKKNAKATGYQIRYSLKKNMKSAKTIKVKKAKTVKQVVKNLKSKKTYYVQIRAYKTVGGKTYYSAWSGTKKVKVK